AAKRGLSGLRSQADELLDYAERRVRAAVQSLPRGTWRAEDFLESAGSQSSKPIRICVEVTIGGSGVTVDFQGTDRQVVGNVNAPFAVTLSATYYVVRCITDPEAPRNAGAFRPVRVLADAGLLVHPRPPAAVAAGNVETSQRIVDVLFLALAAPLRDRVPAQSQGTMNNLTTGASRPRPFSYYEPIAGGEDGRPGRNLLRRGKRQRILPAKVTFELRRDDLVVIETPGGGGWGPAETRGHRPVGYVHRRG